MWGATDRKYSKQRPGEATQWAVIEWALEQGCSLYDLEGIDLEGNPGVYAFKKKMGGEEVVLEAPRLNPLTLRGKLIAPLVRTRF
jgi:lipid II:glycine glycyltransferase (peptidoglycan interpeptide bridge formation enzyme)